MTLWKRGIAWYALSSRYILIEGKKHPICDIGAKEFCGKSEIAWYAMLSPYILIMEKNTHL
jgi:hypothetical protein